MDNILKLIGGLGWTITYIVLIYNGFKYKRYAIPFFALALNFSWELIYSFYEIDFSNITLQRSINILWLFLDLLILYQYFVFGRGGFSQKIPTNLFYPVSIAILIICFMVEYVFLKEFIGIWGAKYSAFLQNLLMSFLFISFLLNRDDIKDISMTVAISKWIGTLAQTIVFGKDSQFIFIIGILCAIVDLSYVFLLYRFKSKKKYIQSFGSE
jgi:hypothetical protein